VIWLFMEGGPSHIDLFDPKPELDRLAGQPMPESFGRPITAMGTADNTLMPSKRNWKQYGQAGIWISDWYSEVARHADDLCVIRSCWADGLNHVGSVCQMNTGDILAGRPAMGAWMNYGLGSANENLPAFVIMMDGAEVFGGPKNWSSGFLPRSIKAHRSVPRGRPSIIWLRRRVSQRRSNAASSICWPGSTSLRGGQSGQHRTRRATEFLRTGLAHANVSARSGGHLE